MLDIRRLFSRKSMVALCILSPVLVMILFASILMPLLFTGRGLHFNLAMLQEDDSLEVRFFITQLVNSHALADVVTLIPVDSLESGLELLERQEASVLMHVPPRVLENIRNHSPIHISIIGTEAHALEQSLIAMTLGQSLFLVGQSQNQMEAARNVAVTKGVPAGEADLFLQEMTYDAIGQYLFRRQVLGENGSLSPLGEYLPVEYYLAAIFALFATFAMLPLIHYTAADVSGAILHRGLTCGRGAIQFYLARLGSGTLFIMLVLLMLLPTTLLLDLADQFIGSAYRGNLPALLLTMLLTAFAFSTLAVALAVWIARVQPAIWTGFYLILGMAVAGGALVPEGSLPDWLIGIGRWLPLRATMRGLANSLFAFDPVLLQQDMLKLALLAAVFLPLGLWGFARKEYGR
jgi:hypothetical protein